MDEDFPIDTNSARCYILGPMTLVEWVLKSDDLEELMEVFEENHPELVVTRNVVVSDKKDTIYLRIFVSEWTSES